MRSASLLLTLGLLGLTGCITAPPVAIAPPTTRSSDKVVAAAAPVVRADQVTPQSAEKMYQACVEEIDRDQQDLMGPAMPRRD